MTAPRKAKTPQGRQAKGVFNTTSSATILTDMLESIKPVLHQKTKGKFADDRETWFTQRGRLSNE